MGREFIQLGQVPYGEVGEDIDSPNYRVNAKRECQTYIQAIRNYVGPVPEGAELVTRAFLHEFGRYFEVVCYYDPANPDAEQYALNCERQVPRTWAEGRVKRPPRETGTRWRSG